MKQYRRFSIKWLALGRYPNLYMVGSKRLKCSVLIAVFLAADLSTHA